MQAKEPPSTIVKSIRFDQDLADKIEELKDKAERDFSQQVRFMLKEYIKMKETN